MSLRLRLFAAFALIAGLSLFFVLEIVVDELKPAMRQAMEETLIDTSLMLAEVARDDFRSGNLTQGRLVAALKRYAKASPDALVWGIRKVRTDHRVYVTDCKGLVLFDSDNGRDVGEDYSRWNDVYLTLRGKYGARSSPSLADGKSVLYVAAPILDEAGRIQGVLSVGKPSARLEPYFDKTQNKIIQAGVLLFLAALAVSVLLAWWHGRDAARLVAYTDARAKGKTGSLPRLNIAEIKRIGNAVEKMREELEGKKYVEEYVHSLTHELKSPLTAIGGAVEILGSDGLAEEDRRKFLDNIRLENERIRRIIERLLDLASLEKRGSLNNVEEVDLCAQVRELAKAGESRFLAAGVRLDLDLPRSLTIRGESFLCKQALDNLLSNGLEFTPRGGRVTVSGQYEDDFAVIEVLNSGDPVPEYALDRLFERFYSLPRPGTGKKSTGLGLPFAREAAELHGGDVRIENAVLGGVRGVIRFAKNPAATK